MRSRPTEPYWKSEITFLEMIPTGQMTQKTGYRNMALAARIEPSRTSRVGICSKRLVSLRLDAFLRRPVSPKRCVRFPAGQIQPQKILPRRIVKARVAATGTRSPRIMLRDARLTCKKPSGHARVIEPIPIVQIEP